MASNAEPRRGARTLRRAAAPVRVQAAAFALLALLLLTLIGPAMTYDATGTEGSGSAIRQIGYLLVAAITVYAVRGRLRPERLLAVPLMLVAALGWCWLSMVWAIDPGTAVRRVVLTTLVVWTCFVLVRQIGYATSLTLIRIALAVALAANWITVELFPYYAIHQVDALTEEGLIGDWRGFMAHKNMAGLLCALTVLFFLFDRRAMPRLVQIAVLAPAIGFLVLSSSRTAMSLCVAAVAVGLIVTRYKARYKAAVIVLLVIGAVAFAALQNVYTDPLLRELDDPTAFTGRTQIWQVLFLYIRTNPWLGAGFGSFFNIGGRSPMFELGSGWVTEVTQGHNGFLDLIVQIGFPGLVLVLLATVAAPVAQLLRSRAEGPPVALVTSVLLFIIAHQSTESTIFDRDSLGQVFLMLDIALIWSLAAASGDDPMRRARELLAWANRRDEGATPRGETGDHAAG